MSIVEMWLDFKLLIFVFHVTNGCDLVSSDHGLKITAQTGSSVLLPCRCSDLNNKPSGFKWKQLSDEWKDVLTGGSRFKLVNDEMSPGNLSLSISGVTVNDGGLFRCQLRPENVVDVTLTVIGCDLVFSDHGLKITEHTGSSVLLPCRCSNLYNKPSEFKWKKLNVTWDELSTEGSRFKLVNDLSPGNLSLLVSDLTEKDSGVFRCDLGSYKHIDITLSVTGMEPSSPSTVNSDSNHYFILILVPLLLLVIGGVIFWKYRAQRPGQTGQKSQRDTQLNTHIQDDVMYTYVDYNKTSQIAKVTNVDNNTEYACIKLN